MQCTFHLNQNLACHLKSIVRDFYSAEARSTPGHTIAHGCGPVLIYSACPLLAIDTSKAEICSPRSHNYPLSNLSFQLLNDFLLGNVSLTN